MQQVYVWQWLGGRRLGLPRVRVGRKTRLELGTRAKVGIWAVGVAVVVGLMTPKMLVAQEVQASKEQAKGVMRSDVGPFEQGASRLKAAAAPLSLYTIPIIDSTLTLFRLIYQTPKGMSYLSYPHPFDRAILQDFSFTFSTREGASLPEPEKPTISLEQAVAALVAEQPRRREERANSYGKAKVAVRADAGNGGRLFQGYCGNCHGERGEGPAKEYNNSGKGLGPFGSTPPYLFLKVLPLDRRFAGGDTPQFAERSAFGVHATLPEMSGAAVLSQEDWEDLQAWMAQLDGP